jgi:Protein of unknown function (DUF1431)
MASKSLLNCSTKALNSCLAKRAVHTQLTNLSEQTGKVILNRDAVESKRWKTDPNCIPATCSSTFSDDKHPAAARVNDDPYGAYMPCPCPEPIAPRACYEIPQLVEPPRRERRIQINSATTPCQAPNSSKYANPCNKVSAAVLPCPSFQMPGCRPSKKPPKCIEFREVIPCERIVAPHPSFADSDYEIPRSRFSECMCPFIRKPRDQINEAKDSY